MGPNFKNIRQVGIRTKDPTTTINQQFATFLPLKGDQLLTKYLSYNGSNLWWLHWIVPLKHACLRPLFKQTILLSEQLMKVWSYLASKLSVHLVGNGHQAPRADRSINVQQNLQDHKRPIFHNLLQEVLKRSLDLSKRVWDRKLQKRCNLRF